MKNKKNDWSWARRVDTILKDSDITRRDLAIALGVANSTVTKWFAEEPPKYGGPNEEQIKLICEILDETREYLFDGINAVTSLRYIPLVYMSDTLTFETINKQIEDIQSAEKAIPCPVNASNEAFAIRITNSMFKPRHIVYGSTIILDVQAPISPGSIGLFEHEARLLVRVWEQIDGIDYLTLPDPSFPFVPVDNIDAVVKAVAIHHISPC